MPPNGSSASFGPFRLDTAKRVLWRGSERVALPPKTLDLLVALVEQQGDVVEKAALMDRVWPDTFVEEANLSVNVAALRKALGDGPDGRSWIETVPRRGYRFTGAAAAGVAAPPSLAVLPLKRLGPGADDDYLGLAMADALITRLGRTGQVVVRSTSAIIRYAGAGDAAAAARELGVDAALDGTYQREGGRLRVSVQLVARDGSTTWADTFEDDFTNLFAVQDAAAARLADALSLRLGSRERSSLTRRQTDSFAAYEAYARGRFFWTRFTGPWLERAVACFHEAVEADPGYALPHAGLADAFLILGFSGLAAPREAWPLAEEEARRALAQDEALAAAHVALAYVRLFQDWDWPAAADGLQRALALEPHSAAVHQWHGLYLDMLGRLDEAAEEVAEAQRLDPVSLVASTLAGFQRRLARDPAGEERAYRRTLELDPAHFLGHWGLGLAYQQLGRVEDAVAEHRQASALAGEGGLLTPVLARSLALAGDRAGARRALREASRGGLLTSRYQRATVHAALGEHGPALFFLERACEERDPWVVWLRSDPMLDELRGSPRFAALEAAVFARAPRASR